MMPEYLTAATARAESERFISQIGEYPGGFSGRGIVICAGGIHYFTNAWVCINMLRRWNVSVTRNASGQRSPRCRRYENYDIYE